VGLIVRTIAVLLFEGDCAAFTDINLPVIALSPIFRGATLTTSLPGPLPAVSGKQLGNRSNERIIAEAVELYEKTQILGSFQGGKPGET
jgi:hypothetical protein